MSYVAFQYAEALFSLALEENAIDTVRETYEAFLTAKDHKVTIFLNHPKVHKQDKKDVLQKAVKNTVFLHFLYVLIDNQRMDLINDCFDEFMKIVNNQDKVMDVTVYSQQPLTQEELVNLQQSIGTKHSRTVRLENVVDKTILGGVRIEYEGHVLDQTINNYLHSLKNNLTR